MFGAANTVLRRHCFKGGAKTVTRLTNVVMFGPGSRALKREGSQNGDTLN
jgi:hypothetical protein